MGSGCCKNIESYVRHYDSASSAELSQTQPLLERATSQDTVATLNGPLQSTAPSSLDDLPNGRPSTLAVTSRRRQRVSTTARNVRFRVGLFSRRCTRGFRRKRCSESPFLPESHRTSLLGAQRLTNRDDVFFHKTLDKKHSSSSLSKVIKRAKQDTEGGYKESGPTSTSLYKVDYVPICLTEPAGNVLFSPGEPREGTHSTFPIQNIDKPFDVQISNKCSNCYCETPEFPADGLSDANVYADSLMLYTSVLPSEQFERITCEWFEDTTEQQENVTSAKQAIKNLNPSLPSDQPSDVSSLYNEQNSMCDTNSSCVQLSVNAPTDDAPRESSAQ